jgi:hypothetical protein
MGTPAKVQPQAELDGHRADISLLLDFGIRQRLRLPDAANIALQDYGWYDSDIETNCTASQAQLVPAAFLITSAADSIRMPSFPACQWTQRCFRLCSFVCNGADTAFRDSP